MKKINFLIVLMLFVSVGMFAQETATTVQQTTNTRDSKSLYSKKGDYVLPQAGDFSIGMDALPVLNYLGDVFGKTGTNKLKVTQSNIYGRYWLKDDFAVRVNLLMNRYKNVERNYVQDDQARATDPVSQAQLIDEKKSVTNEFYLTLGAQKYRGYGRLRGFAGAVIGYGLEVSKADYQYGNNITETNQAPTTTTTFGATPASSAQASRTLETRGGNINHLIVGGVLGVEYYFAPKICIGIEGYLTADFMFQQQKNRKTETWGGEEVITKDKAIAPKSKGSTIRTHFGNFNSTTGTSSLNPVTPPAKPNNFIPAANIYLMFTF